MAFSKEILTATRWFYRSLKQGDWLWLMLSVALASMTVTSVDMLAQTVKQSMLRQAANEMGADLVIKSTRPIDEKWRQSARLLKLKIAEAQTVVTMASHGDKFQLVSLKGVSNHYPLRGAFKTKPALSLQKLKTHQAVMEPSLFELLSVKPHDSITLGSESFEIAAQLSPSGFISGMNAFAHQILIPLSSMAGTRLIGPGSRVSYEMYFSGSSQTIARLTAQLKQSDSPNLQILTAQAPTEDMKQTLDTAWLFLDLSALSAILVAGLSILIASRFYLQRWQNIIALMRALGAHTSKIAVLFSIQLTWLAFIASFIGVLLGYLGFQALIPVLESYFQPVVQPEPIPIFLKGFAVGLLVLWSFTWLAFQRALKTSPMQLFRTIRSSTSLIHWGIMLALIFTLIVFMTNSSHLKWILAGLMGAAGLFYLAAEALLWLIRRWQQRAKGWLKLSLAALSRDPSLVKIQLISIGLVLFVLMLMTFVRQDLLTHWQASLDKQTPDTFILNVQPDQKHQTQSILHAHRIDTRLVAMTKGRLVKINQTPILAKDQSSNRARRLLARESNIALMQQPPAYNQILTKLTPRDATSSLPWVSVEEGIAELFHIQLGDKLTFHFSGKLKTYEVRSIRKVSWQSFRLNFFFIVQPETPTESQQNALPISYIGSFKLPAKVNPNILVKTLANDVPGVLLIDVKRILKQIQDIMNQATWAVSGLYGFSLLASIIVLFTAIQSSQQMRVQGWLLLRTIGATQKVIVQIGLMEFVLLGGFSGLLAASLAQIASWSISIFMLDIEPAFNPTLWLGAFTLGIALVLTIGWATQRSFLKQSAKSLNRYLDAG